MFVYSFLPCWASRAVKQAVEEECAILVKREAAESLLESQRYAQFTFDNYLLFEGFASSLFDFRREPGHVYKALQ